MKGSILGKELITEPYFFSYSKCNCNERRKNRFLINGQSFDSAQDSDQDRPGNKIPLGEGNLTEI
jgi:hypothetical protein